MGESKKRPRYSVPENVREIFEGWAAGKHLDDKDQESMLNSFGLVASTSVFLPPTVIPSGFRLALPPSIDGCLQKNGCDVRLGEEQLLKLE